MLKLYFSGGEGGGGALAANTVDIGGGAAALQHRPFRLYCCVAKWGGWIRAGLRAIIGAGGAGRAIAFALANCGA